MFGNWEESYQRLQKLLMTYIDQDPTTLVFYHITSTDEDDVVLLHYVFGLSVHAYQDSNTASQLSVLMGPIYMVNIRESCWSQWQPTLTTRYSLSPLLGPVGGGFYSASEIRLAT